MPPASERANPGRASGAAFRPTQSSTEMTLFKSSSERDAAFHFVQILSVAAPAAAVTQPGVLFFIQPQDRTLGCRALALRFGEWVVLDLRG